MNRMMVICILASLAMCYDSISQAAREEARSVEVSPKPMVLGGKITISPGAKVTVRNVDFSKPFPKIYVGSDATIVIDGNDQTPSDDAAR